MIENESRPRRGAAIAELVGGTDASLPAAGDRIAPIGCVEAALSRWQVT